ncbi:kelch repeat-containing protein [Hydrogenophaga sp.]|uniref:kelch repeat-containing protein n=1 Tax=Hydrogenophaga sp. TaxID=1904254 RepID=UPI00271822DA|nr:kelch repeat-containing protein [Hydrogenophaga sp.]MDO9438037.1 kelch repeat-containing protein [Hydrogenophaga sp.]
MTHPLSRTSTATPTQRNRRLLLTLPACALPMLSACGGGADFIYDTEQALYVVGEPITPNKPKPPTSNPTVTAQSAPTFFVVPALPAGLTLNTKTGEISGTPTKLKRQGTHIVIAKNNKGIAETQLRITVTGRGAWIPAATVPRARQAASISPLPGGKLLVAGGQTDDASTNSTDIYDPSTAAWNSAAPMLYPRSLPVAVALRGGRVLVLSGDLYTPDAGAAELYDPVANAWMAAGRMNEVRMSCTAHLLPSGKVLVVGGFNSDNVVLNSAEVYDPMTGAWTLLPTRLSAPRTRHAAVLLSDGKTLLVIGGAGVTTAELYKVDGSATKVIPYGIGGEFHQAVKLDDGSVLAISGGSNSSRRFNPATSSWTTSTMLSGERSSPTVTLLADGRVLVAGGTVSNTAEIYNPDVNRWTAAAPMADARQRAVAALLGDGSVLVVSGVTSDGVLDASERYIP